MILYADGMPSVIISAYDSTFIYEYTDMDLSTRILHYIVPGSLPLRM